MNQQHLCSSADFYIIKDISEATDISEQIIKIFIRKSTFEYWHLILAIFDNHPNLRWTFLVGRLGCFTIKTRTKFNLIFITE